MASPKEDEPKRSHNFHSSSSSSCHSLLVLVSILVLHSHVEDINALRSPLRNHPSSFFMDHHHFSWTPHHSSLLRHHGPTPHQLSPMSTPDPPQPSPPQPPSATQLQPPLWTPPRATLAPPSPTLAPSRAPPRPTLAPSWAPPRPTPTPSWEPTRPTPTPSSSPPRPTPTLPTAPPSSNTSSSSSSSNCSKIDELTEGPYWVEEDIEASDIRQDLPYGLRLNLIFKVDNISTSSSSSGPENNNNGSCDAVENVRIDVWQARYDGMYSDVEEDNTQGETWLRGYQFTNSSGYACFMTIYPGWYSGRTAHIHVRVRTYDLDGNTTLYEDTSQLFFNDTINEEVFNNVYPYNNRSIKRDTYNNEDSLFTTTNVISLVGNYTDGYTSSTIELNIPFSTSSSHSNAFIRRIFDDDDFDQHHAS